MNPKNQTHTEDSLRSLLSNGNSLKIAPILRAINSHEKLLEALRDIVLHESGECDHVTIDNCAQESLRIARSAIAQAEGKI